MLSICKQMGTVKFEHLDHPYLFKVFPLMAGLSAIGMLVMSPVQTAQAQQEELQQLDEFLTPADSAPPPPAAPPLRSVVRPSLPQPAPAPSPPPPDTSNTNPNPQSQPQPSSPSQTPPPANRSVATERIERSNVGVRTTSSPRIELGPRPGRGQLFGLNGLSGGKQSLAGTGIFPGSLYQTIRWQDLRATGII